MGGQIVPLFLCLKVCIYKNYFVHLFIINLKLFITMEITNCFVQSYPIFCIAVHLLGGREDELDVVWGDASKLYSRFLESEFNDTNKSELDCINNFMANI